MAVYALGAPYSEDDRRIRCDNCDKDVVVISHTKATVASIVDGIFGRAPENENSGPPAGWHRIKDNILSDRLLDICSECADRAILWVLRAARTENGKSRLF